MEGRLIFEHGASATCRYDFTSTDRGHLRLPPTMFTAHGEVTNATLELADGSHRSVSVTLGSRLGEATFVVR